MSEEANKENLRQARKRSKANQKARNYLKTATPMGMVSLITQIRLTDILFAIPFALAMLKDILDFVVIGASPAIGIIILVNFVLTPCISLLIILFMTFLGAGGKRKTAKLIRRYVLIACSTLVEFFFGPSFLPMETLMVIIIYWMVLVDRKSVDYEWSGEADATESNQEQAAEQEKTAAEAQRAADEKREEERQRAADEKREERLRAAREARANEETAANPDHAAAA